MTPTYYKLAWKRKMFYLQNKLLIKYFIKIKQSIKLEVICLNTDDLFCCFNIFISSNIESSKSFESNFSVDSV